MALDHDPACGCKVCGHVRRHAHTVTADDRRHLAREWHFWIGADDGEVRKLALGENGAPGSPRWVALQAIAAARIAAETARDAAASPGIPKSDAVAVSAAAASIARPIGPLRSGQSTTLDDGA